MGCIQVFETQQPNPLVFSSVIACLILLKEASKYKTVSEKNFTFNSVLALMIIFFLSLGGVTCSTPCSWPCNVYTKLKEQNEFYVFIAWIVFVQSLLLTTALKLYKFVIVKSHKNVTPETEEINLIYFIFLCLHVMGITVVLILFSFLSLFFSPLFSMLF